MKENIKELEKLEAEKVKKSINEIEKKVEELLAEIKEVKEKTSNWQSLEHVRWQFDSKGIKGIISERTSEIMKKIDDEIQRLKPILKEIRESKK
jgi:hypothetical protein